MTVLFGQEHVDRYRETDGEEGHIWREGSTILLLTTTGRKTGNETTTPLIYDLDGDGNPVIVASKGGAPAHPGWYENLAQNPEVGVQIKGDTFHARARVAEGEERERLWRLMNEMWPHYAEYAEKTDREIPVVVLERV
jgi:proline iminopeptidase